MCNKIATEFVDGTKPKPLDKIKAFRPQIIVTGTVEKPYYEILYYDISDKIWHIGYSSYNLANVIAWKDECFEVVGEIEDMQPTADVVEVIRCEKCKHGNVSTISKTKDGQEKIACYCNLKKMVTDIDDYCPNGERSDTV